MQIRTDANQSFDNIIFSETNYGQAESVSPNFSYFQQTFTEPSEIKFFNQSNGMTGWYFWDFGDGNTSIEQNPSHTYTDLGPYTVSSKNLMFVDELTSGLFVLAKDNVLKEPIAVGVPTSLLVLI